MIDVEEIKQKIFSFLNERGPSLPVKIAKHIELSPMFSSAILSELLDEKKIKTSSLRVGSSPLYLVPGQEEKLELFTDNLTGFEKEAYIKLKQNKILQDESQGPQIRIALRAIKDFAIPLRYQDNLYWKYFSIPNNEAQIFISTQTKTPQPNNPQNPGETIQKLEQEKPILEIKEKKPKIKKQPEDFLNQIKDFLTAKDIELLRVVEYNKKEVTGMIRINSDFGKISFLMIAKNKKKANIADLTLAYQKSQKQRLPCYFLTLEGLATTTKDFIEEHKNLLKIDKLEQ